jgi:hypothetical protein
MKKIPQPAPGDKHDSEGSLSPMHLQWASLDGMQLEVPNLTVPSGTEFVVPADQATLAWLESVREAGRQEALATLARAAPAPAKGVIWSLGDGVYQVGPSKVRVNDREDDVLQTFLPDQRRQVMDTATLNALSGHEDAARILRDLRHKYDRVFRGSILLPGRKGRGGYDAQVRLPSGM